MAVGVRVPPSAPVQMIKNILLINPWIYDFTAYDFWMKPLGLLYMASILKEHTHSELYFLDCLDRDHPRLPKKTKTKADGRGSFFKEEIPKPSVLKQIPRKYSRYGIPVDLFLYELRRIPKPEVVLLSCTMTYWYPGVQAVIEIIRDKLGNIPVVLGGVYPTLLPEHAASESGADYIVEGPGEKRILSLLKEILGDDFCSDLRFERLDEMPHPLFDLLRNRESLPVLTSRSCVFDCSFCAAPVIFPEFEQRKPSSVVSELETNYKRFGTRNIAFYDDALLLNKRNHIIPVLKEIISKKLPLVFHTPNGLHVKEIDLTLAPLMKKANFKSIFLSQESFDEDVLNEHCPKVSSSDFDKALSHLDKAGFAPEEINVYLMIGLPGQDAMSVKESILKVKSRGLKPRLAYFSPVPGTRDWKKMVDEGYIRKKADPLIYNKLSFPYIGGDFSSEDFENLKSLL